jgi:hypothetical protein
MRLLALVLVVLVLVLLGGCQQTGSTGADRSKLSRGMAEKLIAEELMKKPPAAKVELRIEVPNIVQQRREWEAFLRGLRERGYEPSVVGDPPSFREEVGPLYMRIGPDVGIMLSLPRDLRVLDLGPYLGCAYGVAAYERGRLLRYGKQVKVRVTGIRILQGFTAAVAEYDYEWEVDEGAKKAVERLRRDFDEIKGWVKQFSFGNRVKVPDAPNLSQELRGNGEKMLRLYDDGWRLVDTNFPEHPCF